MKWKHFPRYWPFVRRIHRSPLNFPHKGQWRGALMFSLIYAWTNSWANNGDAGDLRRHHAHYDVIVMLWNSKQNITISTQENKFEKIGSSNGWFNIYYAPIGLVCRGENKIKMHMLSISVIELKMNTIKYVSRDKLVTSQWHDYLYVCNCNAIKCIKSSAI